MKTQGQSGQATIEFALVLILLLAFVFLFVQLSLVFGWANYIQYATYLSARSFSAAGKTVDEMSARARSVTQRMLRPNGGPRIPFLAREDGDQTYQGIPIQAEGYEDGVREASWKEGVRYRFKSKIFLLPLGRSALPADASALELQSEAWLSHEPADDECSGQLAGSYYDNGC